jgi:glycosidase
MYGDWNVVSDKNTGSVWEWDETTQEYYLHLFCPEQPDLNWENPSVRKAVHEIMEFWLNRGADGFRMDVINFISKDQDFPNGNTSLPWHTGSEHYSAGPRLHEYLQELGSILRKYDAFNVGEMPCVADVTEIIKSVRQDRGELNMIFHFELFVQLSSYRELFQH